MYFGTTSLRELHLRVMTYVRTQCCVFFRYVHFGKAPYGAAPTIFVSVRFLSKIQHRIWPRDRSPARKL
jgi:hypothetical protein